MNFKLKFLYRNRFNFKIKEFFLQNLQIKVIYKFINTKKYI